MTIFKDGLREIEVDDIIVITIIDDGRKKEKAFTITKVVKKDDVYELDYAFSYLCLYKYLWRI